MKGKEISAGEERKAWERFTQMVLAGMIVSNPTDKDGLYSGNPVWPDGVPQDSESMESDSGEEKVYCWRNGRLEKL